MRVIKLGTVQGDDVSIEAGLAPGDQVVVDGADKLREGAKVEPTSKYATPGGGGDRKGGGAGGERGKAPGSTANAASGTAAVAPAEANSAKVSAPGGGEPLSAEERQKRWAEMNARIDRGEFGDEIRKLPEEARKLRMRELRRQREPGAPAGPAAQK